MGCKNDFFKLVYDVTGFCVLHLYVFCIFLSKSTLLFRWHSWNVLEPLCCWKTLSFFPGPTVKQSCEPCYLLQITDSQSAGLWVRSSACQSNTQEQFFKHLRIFWVWHTYSFFLFQQNSDSRVSKQKVWYNWMRVKWGLRRNEMDRGWERAWFGYDIICFTYWVFVCSWEHFNESVCIIVL